MPAHGKPTTVPGIRDRHAMFLEYYLEGDTAFNILQSAVKAGFSEKTAHKQGKRVLQTALAKQERDLQAQGKEGESVLDVVGLSRQDVVDRYRSVTDQDRDYNAKLKALNPVLKEVGVHLQDEDSKTPNIIPIQVNVTSKDPGNKPHIREAE